MATKNGLKYTGKGRILPGAPPRDLSHDEVEQYGGYDNLLASGVYQAATKRRTSKKKVTDGNN